MSDVVDVVLTAGVLRCLVACPLRDLPIFLWLGIERIQVNVFCVFIIPDNEAIARCLCLCWIWEVDYLIGVDLRHVFTVFDFEGVEISLIWDIVCFIVTGQLAATAHGSASKLSEMECSMALPVFTTVTLLALLDDLTSTAEETVGSRVGRECLLAHGISSILLGEIILLHRLLLLSINSWVWSQVAHEIWWPLVLTLNIKWHILGLDETDWYLTVDSLFLEISIVLGLLDTRIN